MIEMIKTVWQAWASEWRRQFPSSKEKNGKKAKKNQQGAKRKILPNCYAKEKKKRKRKIAKQSKKINRRK